MELFKDVTAINMVFIHYFCYSKCSFVSSCYPFSSPPSLPFDKNLEVFSFPMLIMLGLFVLSFLQDNHKGISCPNETKNKK